MLRFQFYSRYSEFNPKFSYYLSKCSSIQWIFFLFLLFLFSFSVNAKTYYVNNLGNDSNLGTSEDSAWRSLDKVNSFVFSPGDQVLFKRGDSWTGTLVVKFSGTAGNPIVYGAYGTGATPKIYGSEVISGWTLHSGNIYKARVNSRVTQLFVDGVRVKAARFPNDGYTHIETVNSTTSFSCDELDGNIDYTGAKWFGRTNDWTAVTRSVISSDSKRLTLDSEVEFGLGVGEGFILMNKLEFLDAAGEWFFDGKTNTVYLWTPKGDSPGNYEVRGSVYDDGVTIGGNRKYITIRDLEILEQTGKGIHMRLNTYVEVSNNILKNQEQYGLYCLGTSHNCSVTNNYVRGQNVRGIYFVSADSDVSGNHVEDIGLFDNIGINSTSSTLFGVGIDVYGNSPGSENTIRYNRIKRTGYTGLYFRGKSFIEFNSISYTCLVKDDGGGIYTPSSTSYNSEIRNNIVLHAIGSSDGLPKDTRRASGIYLDEPTGNIIVEHNTVAYCNGGGIFLHYNGSSQVSNNISYGNRYGLLASREWDTNIFRHNIVYALNISDEAEEHQILTRSHNGAKSVIYDHNTYIHHYNSTEPFRRTSMPESAYYDFEAWKETTNQDKNSTIDTSPLGQGETEELFYNDTKQSKTFDLGTTIYRDIYGTELSGKLTLEPFTSTILIKTTKTVQENQRPEIEGQSFHKTAPIEQNDFIGQVVASDPDADQSLVYSILQGNELNLFALNSTTGELTAHADIQPSEDQTYILTVEVTDNAEASLSASAEIAIHITGINNGTQEPDNTSPQISSFSIPSESNSLTVFIAAFEATDNLGVAGYQLTETEVSPSADSEGWASTAPGEYTFSGEGRHTLYAWVKDEAGNLSSAVSQSILITLPDMSPVYSEYLFEESGGMDVLDSECSNDGVIKNEGFRVDGAKGRGMEFSGKGYIGMGQCFGENVGDEVSMSAWVKPDRNSSGYQGIIMHGGPNTDTYALYLNPDTKTIGFKTSGTTSSWFAADNVDKLWDGNWHHLVAVYNGTEKVIYLDNTAIAEISAEGSIDSGYGYNLLVGAGRDEIDPTLLYEGLLDEVRVYNYALTNTEMGELYHPVNRELNKIYTAEDIVICEGENYMGWTEPGEYERVLQRKLESASGADSVVTTNLTVNPVYSVTIDVKIAPGEDYNGWTEEGTYHFNLTSALGCDSIVSINLTTERNLTQYIELEKGWNIFSSFLIPDDNRMESVMESLRANGRLHILKDEKENTYEEWDAQTGRINNIGNMQKTEGYYILVDSFSTLEISGREIQMPLDIQLDKGKNIISFPYDGTLDALKTVQPLIDLGILEKVQDEKGNAIEYWSRIGWLNGIGDFKAGEGYLVQVSDNGILTMNSLAKKSGQVISGNPETEWYHVVYEGNGFAHMNINVIGLNKVNLHPGDEIAVFDHNVCVGAVKLTEKHFGLNLVSIPASASKDTRNDGFQEGNPIVLELWGKQTNETGKLLSEVIEGKMIFGKHGSVFVSLNDVSQIPEDIRIYPNPARNRVFIQFPKFTGEVIRITLRDITGRQVLSKVVMSNPEILDVEKIPAGIYFIIMSEKNITMIHKLIIV